MRKALIAAVIMGIAGITVIASIGLLMGHNTALITGTTSAIVGIISGLIAHYRAKAKGEKANDKKS